MIYQNKEFIEIPYIPRYFICKDTSEILSTTGRKYKILKPSIMNTTGYARVSFCLEDGTRIDKPIHRLVAEMFVDNPNKLNVVNHLDGCKTNNLHTNLEWTTIQGNTQHAVEFGLVTNAHFKTEIHQYTLSGQFIASFEGIIDAEKQLNITLAANIPKHVKGERPHVGGYQWRYEKHNSIPSVNVEVLKNLTVHDYKTGTVYEFKGRGALKEAGALIGVTNSALVYRFKTSNITEIKHFKLIKETYI